MYTCKYCGLEFESKYTLGGHTSRCKQNPINNKVYFCGFCNRPFNNLSGLHRHENQCNLNSNCVKETRNTNNTQVLGGLFCRFCNRLCKNLNSLAQHEIRCKRNPNKIDTSNAFGNKSTKKTGLPRSGWNKGLTKYTDSRIMQGSLTYIKNHKLGLHKQVDNPSHPPEVRQKISQSCLKRSADGTWHTSLAKDMHIDYRGIDLHGSWEYKFALYLDSLGLDWYRPTERFEYEYKGKVHYYTPDFYIPYFDSYIEIKGYKTGKDYAKWSYFPKSENLKIFMHDDLISFGIKID